MPLSELKASVKMLFFGGGGGVGLSSGTLSPSPNLLYISLNVEGAFSGLLLHCKQRRNGESRNFSPTRPLTLSHGTFWTVCLA